MRVNFLGNNEYLKHYFRNTVMKITILTEGTVFKFIQIESFPGVFMIGSMLFHTPPYLQGTIMTSWLPKVVSV